MPKRHHTIPRCYLRNWTDANGHVWVLDTKDRVFNTTPENIFVESDFYTLRLKTGEKILYVENTLAGLEGAYAAIYENKISKDLFLTEQERAVVSAFIASLYLRTAPNRAGMRGMLENLRGSMVEWKKQFETMSEKDRSVYAASPSRGESITLEDLDSYLGKFDEHHAMNVITELPYIAQIVFDMKWSIWKNEGGNFVTSDDPLVLMRPEAIKKYGPNAIGSQAGFLHKDVDLTLPLSADRLLLAGWILERDSYVPVDDEMARMINYRTITRSSERVIANTKEKVEKIRDTYTETKHKKAAATTR